MTEQQVYEISLCLRVGWQAHSLSNIGTNGSIRTLARRQLLADGTEVDAVSGNIVKRHHAMLLAEYCGESDIALCQACARRDSRRVAALLELPGYKEIDLDRILNECGLCDAHGFLVTPKNSTGDDDGETRSGISKASLIEFSPFLALPGQWAETIQFLTRSNDPMLLKKPARSGIYTLCVRYKSVGVGLDTNQWRLVVSDNAERAKRHQAILYTLRDFILSPDGAMTATMLPHPTSLAGAVVVQTKVGRAPLYSPLQADFIKQLKLLANGSRQVLTFAGLHQFDQVMTELAETSAPYLPARLRQGMPDL